MKAIIAWVLIVLVIGPMSFTISFIPVTLQSLVISLAAWYLGIWRGLLVLIIYLASGAAGLPVFSNYSGGWERLTGPGAGFFLALTFIVVLIGGLGPFVRTKNWAEVIMLNLFAQLIFVISGLTWMAQYFYTPDFYDRFVLPVFPGLMVKVFLGSLIMKLIKKPNNAESPN